MSRMLDAEADKFFGRKMPPVSDSWRPRPASKSPKRFGLVTFQHQYWSRKDRLYELTTWYASERDRDNAIENANKPRKYSPIAAMAKVTR